MTVVAKGDGRGWPSPKASSVIFVLVFVIFTSCWDIDLRWTSSNFVAHNLTAISHCCQIIWDDWLRTTFVPLPAWT